MTIRPNKSQLLALMTILLGGCVELGLVTPIGDSSADQPPTTDGPPADGGGADSTGVPVADLSVSNETPQLGEQVFLTCEVVSGDSTNASYQFTPGTDLTVNATAGIASFIVNEFDLNVTSTFTCHATTDGGTSEPSNSVVVTPTGG